MSTKSIVQDNFKDLLIETSNPKFDNELREGNVLSLLTNDNQYIEGLKKDGCYGMHICTGLWRNNKL